MTDIVMLRSNSAFSTQPALIMRRTLLPRPPCAMMNRRVLGHMADKHYVPCGSRGEGKPIINRVLSHTLATTQLEHVNSKVKLGNLMLYMAHLYKMPVNDVLSSDGVLFAAR